MSMRIRKIYMIMVRAQEIGIYPDRIDTSWPYIKLNELFPQRLSMNAFIPTSKQEKEDLVPKQGFYVLLFLLELAENTLDLKCDIFISVSISLLLVLAQAVGILVLLYLPFTRNVLRKEISSSKLCVTPTEISL